MRALLTSGALSMAFTLFLTPLFIRLFRRLQWGQFIRDDGPQSHHAKRGTATMGGIVVILGTLFGYFTALLLTGDETSVSALLVLFLMVGLGVVGFVDDFLKTRRERSLGLTRLGEGRRPGHRGDSVGVPRHQFPRRPRVHSGDHERVVHPRSAHRLRVDHQVRRDRRPRRLRALPDLDQLHRRRHLQRGERHRRPRRSGLRCEHPGDRRLHHHRVLAVHPVVRQPQPQPREHRQVLRRARSLRPRDRRDGDRRSGGRLPLVEHLARADLPRRHRFARSRRRGRGARDPQPHRTPARAHRRPVRHRGRVGDRAARVLQAHARQDVSS